MLKMAIDFDDVLFPTLENVIGLYNKRYSYNIDIASITTYDLTESLPTDVADELISLFSDKEACFNLQPYKGAVRTVKMLTEQGHEIFIVTSTDIKNMEWKENLLQKYFPFIPKKNFIRIHNKSLLNVDVLVEDKLENLKSTFAERICIDQPWNRDSKSDWVYSIYRIHNWGEIMNIISEIERKDKQWRN